ncbi:hypothetical protein ACHQM5_008996 [Ranunculus cassubicifolius]
MNKIFVLPSNSIPIFILISFLLVFNIPNVKTDDEELLQLCSTTSNYTSGSQFQTNLNLLLNSLVSNGTRDGYFNTSVGVGPDIVYGLAQCRDDLSMASCRSCLKTSVLKIKENCPNGVNATLRYDHCIVRYSGSRFFAERGSVPKALYYVANISHTHINRFTQQRDGLMNNLSKTAVLRPTKFSFGDSDYASSKTIHGVVQCTRDLSPGDCEYCLNDMITWIPDCCNRSKGAQIFSTTCYLRYDIKTFMENSSQFPPMPAPSFPLVWPPTSVPLPPQSSPAPVSTSNTTNTKESNGTGGGKYLNILLIIVSMIASLMLE